MIACREELSAAYAPRLQAMVVAEVRFGARKTSEDSWPPCETATRSAQDLVSSAMDEAVRDVEGSQAWAG